MKQTNLQNPPQVDNAALREWLQKAQEAITELQRTQIRNDEATIEHGVGLFSASSVDFTADQMEFASQSSHAVVLAPVVVGLQVTGVRIFGRNPAGSAKGLICRLTESLDETAEEKRLLPAKTSPTKASERWSVDLSGADAGLPRRVRSGGRLALEITTDGTAGASSFVSLVRWSYRKNAETDYRNSTSRRT